MFGGFYIYLALIHIVVITHERFTGATCQFGSAMPNTQASDGSLMTSYTNFNDCSNNCLRVSTCYAIDWVPINNACYFHGQNRPTQSQAGVTHYQISNPSCKNT